MALVSAKAEAVAGNHWLRGQNVLELQPQKGRSAFLKVLNGNAETHACPVGKGLQVTGMSGRDERYEWF